jgi:hypothetical protein
LEELVAQRESRLSRDIRRAIQSEYGPRVFIFKVWGSEHMMAGLPDLIGCIEGRFFGLEVKHPETRGVLSERQKYVGSIIQGAGGFWAVVTNSREALSALADLLV